MANTVVTVVVVVVFVVVVVVVAAAAAAAAAVVVHLFAVLSLGLLRFPNFGIRVASPTYKIRPLPLC
jgi:hypothetical protein